MNENLELTPDQALTAAKTVIACLTPVIVWLAKTVSPKVPRGLLPAMTPLIGIAFGYMLNSIGFTSLNWTDAAVSGALGVFVREAWDQNVRMKDTRDQDRE